MRLLPKAALGRNDHRRIVHPVMNEREFCNKLEACYCNSQLTGNVGGFVLGWIDASPGGSRSRIKI